MSYNRGIRTMSDGITVQIKESIIRTMIIDGEKYNIGLSHVNGITITRKSKYETSTTRHELKQKWNMNPLEIKTIFEKGLKEAIRKSEIEDVRDGPKKETEGSN